MDVLGLIPARGGSTRIPRKNLAPLAGRPLIAHTCEAALASTALDRVLVSTDDEEIAAAARAEGVEAPFLRPAGLARADTPSIDVVLHALDWLRDEEAQEPTIVVLLQPTSPLRPAARIDEAVALLRESGADTVVTVTAIPHVFHPISALTMAGDGTLAPYLEGEGTRLLRSEDKPATWARNGPGVVASLVESVRRERSLYGSRTVGLAAGRIESLDVDDPEDLALCEAILRAREA